MNKAELLDKYGNPIKILDHGHVRLVDLMGDDQAVVQAARVSYGLGGSEHVMPDAPDLASKVSLVANLVVCEVCGKVPGTAGVPHDHCAPGDRRLIRYLMRRNHTTPFEMCEIKLHCKMPIFVARQWIRHRTANVNEYSMRYSPAIRDFYRVAPDGWRSQSGSNKQGSEGTVTAAMGRKFSEKQILAQEAVLDQYDHLVKHGTARELARVDLSLSMYTEWYWKLDVHNLLHFLRLRIDPHAQYEIRVFAGVIAEIIKRWMPATWEAFVDYKLHAHTFSRQEMELLRDMMAEYAITKHDFIKKFPSHGMTTKRENKDFLKALELVA